MDTYDQQSARKISSALTDSGIESTVDIATQNRLDGTADTIVTITLAPHSLPYLVSFVEKVAP